MVKCSENVNKGKQGINMAYVRKEIGVGDIKRQEEY